MARWVDISGFLRQHSNAPNRYHEDVPLYKCRWVFFEWPNTHYCTSIYSVLYGSNVLVWVSHTKPLGSTRIQLKPGDFEIYGCGASQKKGSYLQLVYDQRKTQIEKRRSDPMSIWWVSESACNSLMDVLTSDSSAFKVKERIDWPRVHLTKSGRAWRLYLKVKYQEWITMLKSEQFYKFFNSAKFIKN